MLISPLDITDGRLSLSLWPSVCYQFAQTYASMLLNFWKKTILNRICSKPCPRPSFSRWNVCNLFYLRVAGKWWEIEQTILLPSNRKSCIFHRMAPLKMLYMWSWPTFSSLHISKCEYLKKGESEQEMLKYDFDRTVDIGYQMRQLQML